MKRFLLPLLLLYPLLTQAQSAATIHCTFASPSTDSCTIIPQEYFIDQYDKSYHATIRDNECQFTFKLALPTTVQLIFNNQTIPLFIEPDDDLKINITGTSPSDLSFSCEGAANNEYLTLFNKTFNADFNKDSLTSTILHTDLDAFEMNLFDERKKQLDFYNNFKSKEELSASFRKYIE